MERWEADMDDDKLEEQLPDQPEGDEKEKKESPPGRDMYMNVRILVSMMAVFVLLFTFAARVIVVSGPSMENTLQNGDLILVWSIGYKPKQGDIVVLTQEIGRAHV